MYFSRIVLGCCWRWRHSGCCWCCNSVWVWRGEWLYKEMKNFFYFFVFFPFFLFYNTLHDLHTTSAILMELELELKLCFQKLHNHFLLFFTKYFDFFLFPVFISKGRWRRWKWRWLMLVRGWRNSCSCYILLPHNVLVETIFTVFFCHSFFFKFLVWG